MKRLLQLTVICPRCEKPCPRLYAGECLECRLREDEEKR